MEYLEKALITCFTEVKYIDDNVVDFYILAIPRATQLRQVFLSGPRPVFKKILSSPELAATVRSFIASHLKQGDFDSIERAIKAKLFFGNHLDVMGGVS